MRNKKAFTLMELIVVLAVLAILMAIGIPTFLTLREQSANRIAEENLQVIHSAFQLTKSIGTTGGNLPKSEYEMTVHKDAGNPYEVYLNQKVDSLLAAELLDQYDIWESNRAGTTDTIVRYRTDKRIYTLQNGVISSIKEEETPVDPVEDTNHAGKIVFDHMSGLSNYLQDKTDAERRAFFEEAGLNTGNNLSNDTYRQYLYKVNGGWPEMTPEFKAKYGIKAEHLYIQPFMFDVKDPSTLVIFATPNGTVNGGWYTGYIYDPDEGVWYTGPGFSINGVAGKTWSAVKAEMLAKGWKPVG